MATDHSHHKYYSIYSRTSISLLEGQEKKYVLSVSSSETNLKLYEYMSALSLSGATSHLTGKKNYKNELGTKL